MGRKIKCIIPARGGSKRIPRKNIVELHGKPLIYYTIREVKKSGLFDEVLVSTEDEEIMKVSEKFGARVIRRRKELATDKARVIHVVEDFLLSPEGSEVDYLFVFLPTAPFRKAQDITGIYKLISENPDADGAMAVTKYWFPPFWALEVRGKYIKQLFPDKAKKSQEMLTLYVDAGSIYAVKRSSFLKYKTFYMPKTLFYEIPRLRAIDIDEEDDLKLAECLMKCYFENKEMNDKSVSDK